MVGTASVLRRAQHFDRALRERAAPRHLTHSFGGAILCPSLPRVWDLNAAFLDVELDRGDADGLIAEVEGLQSEARLRHRRVLIANEEVGQRLLPRFEERGWTHSWWVYMVHDGMRASDPRGGAEEVTRDVARDVETQALGEDAYVPDEAEVLRQLIAGRDRLAAATPARFFVGRAQGRAVSVCTLYSHEGVAQLDDVATLAAYRGQGWGRAVVQSALDAALHAEHDLVFVVADDADWPKHLYRRLGFEPVGRALNLVREPARRP